MTTVDPERAVNSLDPFVPWQAMRDYWVDGGQRTVLFWDVLRQRSERYYAENAKATPHVLSFDSELGLDGRTFARPVNYGLVRITPPPGVVIAVHPGAEGKPCVIGNCQAGWAVMRLAPTRRSCSGRSSSPSRDDRRRRRDGGVSRRRCGPRDDGATAYVDGGYHLVG